MKIILICILVVAMQINAQQFKIHAIRAQPPGRLHLSHSRVVIEDYLTLHKRHDLSSYLRHQSVRYEQSTLITNHLAFLLPLTVAGLSYNLSIDTGSADIFIKGENAPGLPLRKYKSRVNYKKVKKQFPIGYLDGKLSTYEETLPVQFKNYTIQTPLLVAYTSNAQFKNVQGLVGLSFPQLATHRPTFIETLIKNDIISTYAYGVNLNLIQNGRSFITFGDKDPNFYVGELNEFKIKQQSKQIKIDFQWVKFGNSQQMPVQQALLDTGNTCISIPRRYEKIILNAFKTNNNRCVFQVQVNVPMFSLLSCRIGNFDQLPNLILSIEGHKYQIEKQYFLQRCAQRTQNGNKVYYCDTYIQSVQYRKSTILLGDGFFNRFYTFFDLENSKVGIAQNKQHISLDQVLGSEDIPFDSQDWQGLLNEDEKEEQAYQ